MTSIEQAREAVKKGDVETLKALLGADEGLANATTEDNRRTLLHTLTDYPGHWPNNRATAKVLIDAGADVNARFPHPKVKTSRETPLHWAASCDDVEMAEILLDAGADIDSDGGIIVNGTPAYNAVVFRGVNVANVLINRGATVNLMIAAGAGRHDLVDTFFAEDGTVLASAGALPSWEVPRDPDVSLNSAFGFACRNGHVSLAKRLLERGADPTWMNAAGDTAWKQAKDGGWRTVMDWLKCRGIEA